MKYEKTICIYPAPSSYFTIGLAGFVLFGLPSNSPLIGLIGILVGIVAAHVKNTEKFKITLENPQEPPERTQPQELAQTTTPPENAAQNANNEPPKPEGVVVGIAVDGEKPSAELILEPSLRIRHLYLIGKTRTGKTTLIKNLALQDMEQGAGLCFVDPHGDAAEDLIGSIPQHRIQDVIYFDPASETCPAFNILRTSFAPQKLTEDIVNVLKMFFGSSWGFRMEHILRYAILTLLHDPEPRTLKDLRTLLVSEKFRAEIIANIQDESIREFWELEFAEFPRGAVDPIVNKLSSFLVPGSPLLKLFSQKENALDFSRIMNEQKILIVNLSKGLLSEDPSRLLGGLIVTGIQQAALGRANMPPNERKDFHLYLDEFQNFVVESFESILSEAAKYKLFLTLAHQTLGQVPAYLKHGIFGNVATLIAFQISAEDAATVQREMRRVRYQYRVPKQSEYLPLSDLIEQVKNKYREHDTDEIRKAKERIGEYVAKKNDPAFWEAIVERVQRERDREHWKSEIEKQFAYNKQHLEDQIKSSEEWLARYMQRDDAMVERLSSPDLPPNVLKELTDYSTGAPLFADYAFKQTTFPDVDDLINQQPRHAFCRRERAENVTLFRTLPAPDPNPAVKAAVLEAMKARTEQHSAKVQRGTQPLEQPTSPPDTSIPANPIAEKLWPEMPKEKPQAQEATPKPEIDPVEAARERRAQKGTPKRSTSSRTPAPQNEEDFNF